MINHLLAIICTCIIGSLAASTSQLFPREQNVLVIDHAEICLKDMDHYLPSHFVVRHISFDTDISMSSEEIRNIFGIVAHTGYTPTDIHRALWYLQQKNIVEKAILHITWYSETEIEMVVEIRSFWTLERIKITGILFGKDVFEQAYLMQPGDRFDPAQHHHSLKKMNAICRDQGYLQAQLFAFFRYNAERKTVQVTVKVIKNTRFTIKNMILCADNPDVQDIAQLLEKKFLHSLIGDPYERKCCNEVAQRMRTYMIRQGYMHVSLEIAEDIDYEQKKVTIHWHIIASHKRSFIFVGNNFFPHHELLTSILQFGRSAGLLPIEMLAEEITRTYMAKGFWTIKIETEAEQDKYFFIITEGSRARIKDVVITTKDDKSLLPGLRRAFRLLLKKKYYDEELINQSINDLIDVYHRAGFLYAKITNKSYDQLHGDTYRLRIELDTGDKLQIGSVTIAGFPELMDTGPFEQISSACPMPFNPEKLHEQRQWLLKYFRMSGFLHAHVSHESKTDEQGLLHIIWNIDIKDKPVRFGPTIIQGVVPLSYSIITSLLHYKTQDIWNQEALRRTFTEFKNLEIFEGINMAPGDAYANDEQQPVILRLGRDEPYELKARAGIELQHVQRYHTLAGLSYRLGGAFIIKNPSEVGDRISCDAEVSRSHYEITGEYRRPIIFFIPWIMQAQAYAIKYDQPGFIGANDNIYTLWQNGFLFGLSRKHAPCESGINVGVEWMETAIRDSSVRCQAEQLALAINFSPLLLGKMVPYVFFEPTLFIDYLDNKLNPTRGILIVCSLKTMIPLGSIDQRGYFVRLLIQQSFFFSISSWVYAFRIRLGHIFHRKFSDIMPSERYYLGGSHSLRSYDADLAPPVGVFNNCGKECLVPRGGKSMLNVNAEVRIPLFKYIGGVLFQDIGMLAGDNMEDVTVDNILAGTGFGLRIFTPIGPLRFDIGWKWKKSNPLERAYAWFLTFGHAF